MSGIGDNSLSLSFCTIKWVHNTSPTPTSLTGHFTNTHFTNKDTSPTGHFTDKDTSLTGHFTNTHFTNKDTSPTGHFTNRTLHQQDTSLTRQSSYQIHYHYNIFTYV